MKSYKCITVDGKQIREHVFIAEKKLGRKLRSNEVVHHVDGNIFNNHPDNLAVMTRAEHALLHGSKQRLSKYHGCRKGKTNSDEHRKRISVAKTGEKHHFYGKHLAQEHRAKLGKAVVCIETGQRFDTIRDAERYLWINRGSQIQFAIKHTNHTCHGYHWRYAET